MIYQPASNRLVVRSAFTLMEMLVVVAIIVALAGMGGYYLMGTFSQSKEDIARSHVRKTLTEACKTYWIRNNEQWPPQLEVLLVPDPHGRPPVLEDQDALIDPWGKQYQYVATGTQNNGMRPDIFTVSPSGKTIGNWPEARGVH